MTPSQLAQLRERAEKATPGPWGVEQTSDTNWIGQMRSRSHKIEAIVVSTDREGLNSEAVKRNDMDAAFIAAANPAVILELLDMVERYRSALEFYAIIKTWEWTTSQSTFDGCGCSDFETVKPGIGEAPVQVGGKRARQALKGNV